MYATLNFFFLHFFVSVCIISCKYLLIFINKYFIYIYITIIHDFSRKFPDLLKQFKDIMGFKESGENIEVIPVKIINYENSRMDPEVALDIGKPSLSLCTCVIIVEK